MKSSFFLSFLIVSFVFSYLVLSFLFHWELFQSHDQIQIMKEGMISKENKQRSRTFYQVQKEDMVRRVRQEQPTIFWKKVRSLYDSILVRVFSPKLSKTDRQGLRMIVCRKFREVYVATSIPLCIASASCRCKSVFCLFIFCCCFSCISITNYIQRSSALLSRRDRTIQQTFLGSSRSQLYFFGPLSHLRQLQKKYIKTFLHGNSYIHIVLISHSDSDSADSCCWRGYFRILLCRYYVSVHS